MALEHELAFEPGSAEAMLAEVPALPGVFALRGEDPAAQPYLTRAADLRRRMRRLLAPPEAFDADGRLVLSRRLNLRDRVRRVQWTVTGSEFESVQVLYRASLEAYGEAEARRRLRLHTPYCIRVARGLRHPRAYVTNRLGRRSLDEVFGPFPSRAAAERYCDAVLDLFQLRRCHEELDTSPDHPGCVYGEIGKCLEPCKLACSPERYGAEAEAVYQFFLTCGESLLGAVAAEREAASDALDFERAATLHTRWERVRAAAVQADGIVRPLPELRCVIVQPAAKPSGDGEDADSDAALFLLDRGRLHGPVRLPTLGVRAVREQTAVGSSLFAQPLMLAPVPLADAAPAKSGEAQEGSDPSSVALAPEDRARAALAALESKATAEDTPASPAELGDTLSLFRRWYFRPEKSRVGACFTRSAKDGGWPVRRILNASARAVLGPPVELPPADREAAAAVKRGTPTRTLHAGRADVQRKAPVLPPRAP